MKRKIATRAAAVACLAVSLSGAALAVPHVGEDGLLAQSETLKDAYHKESELGIKIVTDKEFGQLTSLLADPKLKILCAQITPKLMDAPKAQALLDWVRAGHSLWIYNAHLGPWFGFEPIYMKETQFSNKPLKGDLGGHKVEGTGAPAMALKGGPLVTGVDGVSTWLPKLADGTYGAVAIKADTVPLLQFTVESPAVAAYRREGRGLIVFKPLVWTEPLTGERFQRNLLEYSAGFQVPGDGLQGFVGTAIGPKAEYVKGSPAVPLLAGASYVPPPGPKPPTRPPGHDPTAPVVAEPIPGKGHPAAFPTQTTLIDCRDGVFNCTVLEDPLKFETGDGSLKLHPKDIKSIVIGDVSGLDIVTTWDGQRRKGFLMSTEIEIQHGKDREKIKKRDLRKLDFQRSTP